MEWRKFIEHDIENIKNEINSIKRFVGTILDEENQFTIYVAKTSHMATNNQFHIIFLFL